MKRKFCLTVLLIFLFTLSGCNPSFKHLKKVIEDNPEEFIEVINNAARKAQEIARQKEREKQRKKRDDEFLNPKKPVIQAHRAIQGNKSAPITIVEYSDFQCPFCRRGTQNIKKVLDLYKGKVRFVFKHLPLNFHPAAMPAAKIFEAIAQQDKKKAYQFHDIVFSQQEKLKTANNGQIWMLNEAKKLGLDVSKIKKDMQSEAVLRLVKSDIEEAKKFGFSGTPGYLINGVSISGALPIDEFKKVIDRHLSKKRI